MSGSKEPVYSAAVTVDGPYNKETFQNALGKTLAPKYRNPTPSTRFTSIDIVVTTDSPARFLILPNRNSYPSYDDIVRRLDVRDNICEICFEKVIYKCHVHPYGEVSSNTSPKSSDKDQSKPIASAPTPAPGSLDQDQATPTASAATASDTPQGVHDPNTKTPNKSATECSSAVDTTRKEATTHFTTVVETTTKEETTAEEPITSDLALTLPTRESVEAPPYSPASPSPAEPADVSMTDTGGATDITARKKVLYYGIKVLPEFDIVAFLEGQFAQCPDKKGFWDQLVRNGRIEMHRAKGWHVTLSMNRPDLKELVMNFEDLLKAGTKQNGDRSSEEEGGVPVKLYLDEIVWDHRAMAIGIKSMDPSLPCADKIPHITVATASDEINPLISNDILAASPKVGGIRRITLTDAFVDGFLVRLYGGEEDGQPTDSAAVPETVSVPFIPGDDAPLPADDGDEEFYDSPPKELDRIQREEFPYDEEELHPSKFPRIARRRGFTVESMKEKEEERIGSALRYAKKHHAGTFTYEAFERDFYTKMKAAHSWRRLIPAYRTNRDSPFRTPLLERIIGQEGGVDGLMDKAAEVARSLERAALLGIEVHGNLERIYNNAHRREMVDTAQVDMLTADQLLHDLASTFQHARELQYSIALQRRSLPHSPKVEESLWQNVQVIRNQSHRRRGMMRVDLKEITASRVRSKPATKRFNVEPPAFGRVYVGEIGAFVGQRATSSAPKKTNRHETTNKLNYQWCFYPAPVATDAGSLDLAITTVSDQTATLRNLTLSTEIPETVGRCLFVGNLDFRLRSQDLNDMFSSAGIVESADALLNATGRSCGCGSITMSTVEEAQEAVRQWNGRMIGGCRMFVMQKEILQGPHAYPKPYLPAILNECVTVVEKRGLQLNGIYRLSGKETDILQLKHQLEADADTVDWEREDKWQIKAVAARVKNFLFDAGLLRITREEMREYSELPNDASRITRMADHIIKVCEPNRDVLQFVLEFLAHVHTYSSGNRFSLQNLARIFTPVLFEQPEMQGADVEVPDSGGRVAGGSRSGQQAEATLKSERLLKDLITFRRKLFDEVARQLKIARQGKANSNTSSGSIRDDVTTSTPHIFRSPERKRKSLVLDEEEYQE
ncbi:hypothetical protein HK097_007216, partial [Rhizophlyctis rosea]